MKKIVTGFSTLSIMGVSTAYLISCTVPVNDINLGISEGSQAKAEDLYAKWVPFSETEPGKIEKEVAPEGSELAKDNFTALNKANNLSKFMQSTLNAFFYSDAMYQTKEDIIKTKTTFRGAPDDQNIEKGVVVSVDGQSSRVFENVSQEEYYSMFSETHITSLKGLYELYKFGLDNPKSTIFTEENKAINKDLKMINNAIGQENSDADGFFKNFLEGYSNSGFTDVNLSFGEGTTKSTYIEGKKSDVTFTSSDGEATVADGSSPFYSENNYTDKEFGEGILGNFEADPFGVRVIGNHTGSLSKIKVETFVTADGEEGYDKAIKTPNKNTIYAFLEKEKDSNGNETSFYKVSKASFENNYITVDTGPVTFEMDYTTDFSDLSGNESSGTEYNVDVTVAGLQAKFVPKIMELKEKPKTDGEVKNDQITTKNYAVVWDFAGYTYNNLEYKADESGESTNLDKFNTYKNDKFEGMQITGIDISLKDKTS